MKCSIYPYALRKTFPPKAMPTLSSRNEGERLPFTQSRFSGTYYSNSTPNGFPLHMAASLMHFSTWSNICAINCEGFKFKKKSPLPPQPPSYFPSQLLEKKITTQQYLHSHLILRQKWKSRVAWQHSTCWMLQNSQRGYLGIILPGGTIFFRTDGEFFGLTKWLSTRIQRTTVQDFPSRPQFVSIDFKVDHSSIFFREFEPIWMDGLVHSKFSGGSYMIATPRNLRMIEPYSGRLPSVSIG